MRLLTAAETREEEADVPEAVAEPAWLGAGGGYQAHGPSLSRAS